MDGGGRGGGEVRCKNFTRSIKQKIILEYYTKLSLNEGVTEKNGCWLRFVYNLADRRTLFIMGGRGQSNR